MYALYILLYPSPACTIVALTWYLRGMSNRTVSYVEYHASTVRLLAGHLQRMDILLARSRATARVPG
jgi:hypothetical protein